MVGVECGYLSHVQCFDYFINGADRSQVSFALAVKTVLCLVRFTYAVSWNKEAGPYL